MFRIVLSGWVEMKENVFHAMKFLPFISLYTSTQPLNARTGYPIDTRADKADYLYPNISDNL
jgi:hypothetical protein